MALKIILDTRFYFSYYNPENSEISAWSKRIVQGVLRGRFKAASSVVTITELYATMGRLIGMDVVKLRIASIKSLQISFIPVTEEISNVAGEIALRIPKVPLADAIIAATALTYANGNVITDDEHFKLIRGIKTKWLRSI